MLIGKSLAFKIFMVSFKFIKTIAVLALFSSGWACSKDDDGPKSPEEGVSTNVSNLSITINADGSLKGDAIFSKIDSTTFFLDYVKYEIVDAHLEITGYDKFELPQIPRLYASITIGGTEYKTRRIAKDSFRNAKITSIFLPSTITGIGDDAFRGCSSLTSVEIPNSVTKIRESTFCNCSALTSVVIPESVTYIGGCAFYDCEKLTKVTFHNPDPYSIGLGYGDLFDPYPTYRVAYVPSNALESYKRIFRYYFTDFQPIQ